MSTPEQHASTLQVELVTPEGPAYSDEAVMVIVPGTEGELGVLPRHAPLVAQLDPGETRIRTSPESWVSFATGAGYFKIQADTASVIVSSAVKADEVDVAAAERELEEAQRLIEQLRGHDEDDRQARRELRRAERRAAEVENRLNVARSQ